ncbi:GIN domain-containing protein [Pedobacter rhodius]|uniref:DUF2807 domain-containing protein n=1 Tax=Pedobacter rhodius TaxID=3004098 RepID=A0ABT4KWC2_9SPHI|nr:DUF2807 domain-containing protein [Pedobacter sp. SJ11]MCZ4223239.1 DUF2807 domain-containing protein [Pedobacter sp. SJ11]
MKTSIKTLIATSLTAIVLTSSVFATSVMAGEHKPTSVSASANNFKRVVIKGNVEITLVQRQNEGVTYADDNTGKAKITQEGNVLKITSADKDVAKLVVYVNDIYRIDAAENAIVKTNGKIKSKYLQIFLKGNAKADINSTTEGLFTVIEDNADLKLTGATDNHTLVMGKTPKLTIDRFAALKTNISSAESHAMEIAALVK